MTNLSDSRRLQRLRILLDNLQLYAFNLRESTKKNFFVCKPWKLINLHSNTKLKETDMQENSYLKLKDEKNIFLMVKKSIFAMNENFSFYLDDQQINLKAIFWM